MVSWSIFFSIDIVLDLVIVCNQTYQREKSPRRKFCCNHRVVTSAIVWASSYKDTFCLFVIVTVCYAHSLYFCWQRVHTIQWVLK